MTISREATLEANGSTIETPPNGLPPWSKLPHLPASLPSCTIPKDVDIVAVGTSFLSYFPKLERYHFTPDALWRDSFALTGTLRTFYSAQSACAAWQEVSRARQASDFGINAKVAKVNRLGDGCEWLDIPFTFKLKNKPAASCSGFLSLIPNENGGWRIWVLKTILEQLDGFGNVDVPAPVVDGKSSSLNNGHHEISDAQHEASNVSETDFDCIVVGGGQSGLSLGGRLQALSISYVVIDKMAEVGDNWRQRYDSTKLHTTREYAHLPFERTFTPEYHQFLPKDELAKGYKQWAKKYGINIWLSTSLESGSFDKGKNIWNLKLKRHGEVQLVSSRYLVFAVGGGSQIPMMPRFPNRDQFKGIILHSANYTSPVAWKGKKAMVVGSANTAHDIAEDMVEAGLSSITMVQRTRTYVLPIEHFLKVFDLVYNAQIPTEWSDRLQFSTPIAVSRLLAMRALHKSAREDSQRYDDLERVGLKVERYGDIQHAINERAGGHYVDVGTSAKIVHGLIKMKSDSPIASYTSRGLLFEGGTEIEADVIVFATGFLGNLREVVGSLLGKEVQDQVQDFWGLNDEGEINGAYQPSGHPAFWYHGGALGHARYFSRFIAMQIKAALSGTPLPVYTDTPFPRLKDEYLRRSG